MIPISPIILAARVTDMKWLNDGGIAGRIKPMSLEFLCSTLAPSIPADADFEQIHLALLRAAMRQPQHFHEDHNND